MKKGVKRSYVTISLMIAATLLSKALGMVRGMMLAWTMGDSTEAVAFAAASKIPCAIFDLLFSAAILGCFIPIFNEARAKSEKASYEYSCSFLSAVMIICALFSVIGMIFAPQIIALVAPGISIEGASLAVSLLRIMFPMMIFTAGAYTLTGILQSFGKFILPAAISALSNAAIIAYLIIAGERFSVFTLSAVFVFSWFLQFLTLALPLIFSKQMPHPSLKFKNEYLLRSAKTAPQIMAGSWLAPATVLIASFFSSFVSDGTFVAYDYSVGLYTIIAGIAVYGVGNFVFPSLSRLAAEKDEKGFAESTSKAVFSIMLTILPVFAATFALSYEGIALLYLRDNFTEELARTCALSLRTLALSMPAYALSEIFYRTFYAAGKVRIPMYATFASIVVCIISNIVFLFVFDAGLFGISLSYTIAQIVYAVSMTLMGKEHFPKIFTFKSKRALHITVGGAVCFASMILGEKIMPIFSGINASLANFLKIAIVFILGLVIYLLYIFITRTLSAKDVFSKRGE